MRCRSAFLLVVAVAGAAGCKKKIDSAKGEKVIAEWLSENELKMTVTCPKDVAIKPNEKFTCEAKGEDGEFKIEVTMLDADGTVTWKPAGSLVDTRKLVEAFKKRNPDHKLAIACSKRLVLLDKKGDTTTCDIGDGSKKGKFVITLDDPEKVTTDVSIKMD